MPYKILASRGVKVSELFSRI